jgi:hypothetical protein
VLAEEARMTDEFVLEDDFRPKPAPQNGGCKLMGGLGLVFCLGLALLAGSWKAELVGALAMSVPAALGAVLVAWGAMNMAGKEPPAAILAVVGVLSLAVCVGAGPPVSRAMHVQSQLEKARETADAQGLRAHINLLTQEQNAYTVDHSEAIELSKTLLVEACKVLAQGASRSKDAVSLRALMVEMAKDEKRFEVDHGENRTLVQEGMAVIYEAALEGLGKEQGDGPAEFPVDEALREAFRAILTDLSHQDNATVFVDFSNRTSLDQPADSRIILQQMYDSLDAATRRAHPKDGSVIPKGDAFEAKYDNTRRDVFLSAMRGAFQRVFSGELLTLENLGQKKREGKLVFEVSSHVLRTPEFYFYTEGPQETFKGFLFEINVEWSFKIFDREGKLLYETSTRSTPAESISVDTGPKDPKWAPYSIMMDSAYYNYSREVIGRFGLQPPPERVQFSFTGH